jgi:uncharacterized protein
MDLEITETESPPQGAKVIIGVPDSGLVGLISASFLIDQLEMKEIASFDSDLFPPVVVLHDGVPKSPMRAYAKDDLMVLISESAIKLTTMRKVMRQVLSWIQDIDGSISVGLTGAPAPNRMDIDTPKVYGVSVNMNGGETIDDLGVDRLQEAMLAGPYAMVLEYARRTKLPNLTLLAQSHLKYPDPGAAAEILKVSSGFLGKELDVQPLMEKADEIRLKMRDLMRNTQKVMKDSGKEREYELPSMYV